MDAYLGASMASSVVGYPFEVFKTRRQLDMRALVLDNSVRTHARGLLSNCMRNTTFIGTKLCVYDMLCGARAPANFGERVGYGMMAGVVGATTGTPFDVLSMHLQSSERPRSASEIVRNIYLQEGARGFWKGYALNVQRAAMVTGCQLGVYNQTLECMKSNCSHHPTNLVVSSVCAGVSAALFSNPIDVCRSRRMRGVLPDTLFRIFSQEGAAGIVRGLIPSMARQVPVNIVRFVMLDYLQDRK